MNTISAMCWNNNFWVKFKLIPGIYNNFLTFLTAHNIYFLAENQLDFTKIPTNLHGYGVSNNLIEYLSNNAENKSLILNFLNYFISNVVKIKYSSGKNLNFGFLEGTNWQTTKFSAQSSYIPTTTTTTTSTPTTTTTTTLTPTTTTTSTVTPTTTTTTTSVPTTTTTTTLMLTTTLAPTTTLPPTSFFEIFGQLYNL